MFRAVQEDIFPSSVDFLEGLVSDSLPSSEESHML